MAVPTDNRPRIQPAQGIDVAYLGFTDRKLRGPSDYETAKKILADMIPGLVAPPYNWRNWEVQYLLQSWITSYEEEHNL